MPTLSTQGASKFVSTGQFTKCQVLNPRIPELRKSGSCTPPAVCFRNAPNSSLNIRGLMAAKSWYSPASRWILRSSFHTSWSVQNLLQMSDKRIPLQYLLYTSSCEISRCEQHIAMIISIAFTSDRAKRRGVVCMIIISPCQLQKSHGCNLARITPNGSLKLSDIR